MAPELFGKSRVRIRAADWQEKGWGNAVESGWTAHSLYKDCITVCHGVGREWTVVTLIASRVILTDPYYESLTTTPWKKEFWFYVFRLNSILNEQQALENFKVLLKIKDDRNLPISISSAFVYSLGFSKFRIKCHCSEINRLGIFFFWHSLSPKNVLLLHIQGDILWLKIVSRLVESAH